LIRAQTIRDALHQSSPDRLASSQRDHLAQNLKEEFESRLKEIEEDKQKFEKEYKSRLDATIASEDKVRKENDVLSKQVLVLEKDLEERKRTTQEIVTNSQNAIQKEREEQDRKVSARVQARESELSKQHNDYVLRHLDMVATFEKTQTDEKAKLQRERSDLDAKLTEYEANQEQIRQDKDQHQKERTELEHEKSQNQRLSQELTSLAEKLQNVIREKELHAQTAEKYRRESQSEAQNKDEALNRLSEAELKHKEIVQSLTDERDKQINLKENSLEKLTATTNDLEKLQLEYQNTLKSLQDKDEQLNSVTSAREELTTKLQNLEDLQETHVRKIEDLTIVKSEHEQTLKTLREKEETLKSITFAQEQQADKLQSLEDSHKKDVNIIDDLKAKYEEALSNTNDFATKHNQLVHNHEDILQNLDVLRNSHDKLTKELEKISFENGDLQAAFETEQAFHDQQYTKLTEKHRALEQEHHSYVTSSGELDSWQARLEEQERSLAKSKQDLVTREDTLTKRIEVLDKNNELFDDLEDRSKKLEESEKEFNTKTETLEQSNKQLQQQWSVYHRALEDIHIRTQALEKADAALEDRINEHQLNIRSKEAELKTGEAVNERLRENLHAQLKEVQRLQQALIRPDSAKPVESVGESRREDIDLTRQDFPDVRSSHESPFKDIGRSVTSAPSTPQRSFNGNGNGVRRTTTSDRPLSYHHPARESGATTPPPPMPIPPLSAGSMTPSDSPIQSKSSMRVKIGRRASQIVDKVSGRHSSQGSVTSLTSNGTNPSIVGRQRSTSESHKLQKRPLTGNIPPVPDVEVER